MKATVISHFFDLKDTSYVNFQHHMFFLFFLEATREDLQDAQLNPVYVLYSGLSQSPAIYPMSGTSPSISQMVTATHWFFGSCFLVAILDFETPFF